MVLPKISDFEQTSFKRSDAVLDTNTDVAASFAVTYGSQRLVLVSITNLKSRDYGTFAMQCNITNALTPTMISCHGFGKQRKKPCQNIV